jgi:LEA14-like dessication related protein
MNKKWLFIGAAVLVFGALAYEEYRRLMNFKITLNKIKINKVSFSIVDFDMILNFANNSSQKFILINQIYEVYLNDISSAHIESKEQSVIYPKSISLIPVNIKLSPSDLLSNFGKNIGTIIKGTSLAKLKVDAKLKVSFHGLLFDAPFTYESTLKDLTKKDA